ncbi:alpha/beta fold hydrolase [Virgibacillus halodenitrificans]|uniref:alpha/beta fold hydrolase n=1 Tax=Virgibacillus halodenitrificans TaxID=1482 RepID=UPI0002D57E31|nr:alpha/beta hydrolase [Virgibacillus halodenitrificans]
MTAISNGNYFKVRGKDLYVEVYGNADAYPLLYLHGGPGESCYEFSYHQAERLKEDFRLIAIDQRGVCRSEKIQGNEHFSIDEIIMDCEALREELGINRWALLGHSFGGYIALKYATMFPDSITRIVFECPTFDFGLSSRSLLRKMGEICKEEEMGGLGEKCFMLADSDSTAKELMLKFIEIRPEIGEKGMKIHVHNFSHKTDYSRYTDGEWKRFLERSNVHVNRLIGGGEMFESILSSLKKLKHPSLLIRGQYDPVTSKEQVMRYQEDVAVANVLTFSNSGHFPHSEEPDKFSKSVVEFLK